MTIFTPPMLGLITPRVIGNFSSVSLNGACHQTWVDPATNIAYIVGVFTTVTDATGTVTRNRAAAINLSTAKWTSWDPNINAGTYRIISGGGDVLYLCGDCTVAGGVSTNAVAKVSKSTGTVDSGFVVTATTLGRAIAINGNDLFVGSNGTIALGKYNATTGARDVTWIVTVLATAINDIATYGTDVYVVGGFTTIQATARNRAATVAQSNAAIGSWNPNITGGNPISLVIDSTSAFAYPLGAFTTVGGTARGGVAQVDLSGGSLQSWAMNAATTASVNSLCTDGVDCWMGGPFTTLDGSARNRVGKGDTATGTLNGTWNPNSSGTVTVVALAANSTIIVFGTFTTIGGQSRTNFAVLDAVTGNAY